MLVFLYNNYSFLSVLLYRQCISPVCVIHTSSLNIPLCFVYLFLNIRITFVSICSYSKYVVEISFYSAQFHASVDGGTNHLYDVFKDDLDAFLPDIITGDFDSIKDSVKKFYQDKVVLGPLMCL